MSLDYKEIAIGLLKDKSCDNCGHHQSGISIINYREELNYKNEEYCSFHITNTIPEIRICKEWKN